MSAIFLQVFVHLHKIIYINMNVCVHGVLYGLVSHPGYMPASGLVCPGQVSDPATLTRIMKGSEWVIRYFIWHISCCIWHYCDTCFSCPALNCWPLAFCWCKIRRDRYIFMSPVNHKLTFTGVKCSVETSYYNYPCILYPTTISVIHFQCICSFILRLSYSESWFSAYCILILTNLAASLANNSMFS